MTKNCVVCRQPFDAKRPNAKFCGPTCRQRSHRGAPVTDLPVSAGSALVSADLVGAVTAELERADRLGSFLGQQAVELASTICHPMTTANAKAALSKELRAVMAEALRVNAKADAVQDARDELAARRAQYAAG